MAGMTEYQVVDLRDQINPMTPVQATSPEDAATKVLGIAVFRSGRRPDLVARVYWNSAEARNMVRLYSVPAER
jgi:hypothetical protein